MVPKISRTELYDYWQHGGAGENAPEVYIPSSGKNELLLKFVEKYIDPDDKILEVGCNVGRSLNFLFNAGYNKLAGVEFSKEAVDLMKKTYPGMVKSAKIYNTPIEEVIKNFKNDAFDTLFTVAAFQCIHPDSNFIFPEIARITKKYLISIENETGRGSDRNFPRNYKKIFERLGMEQVDQFNCKEIESLGADFWVRVFKKHDE